jgi:hypothetical protein
MASHRPTAGELAISQLRTTVVVLTIIVCGVAVLATTAIYARVDYQFNLSIGWMTVFCGGWGSLPYAVLAGVAWSTLRLRRFVFPSGLVLLAAAALGFLGVRLLYQHHHWAIVRDPVSPAPRPMNCAGPIVELVMPALQCCVVLVLALLVACVQFVENRLIGPPAPEENVTHPKLLSHVSGLLAAGICALAGLSLLNAMDFQAPQSLGTRVLGLLVAAPYFFLAYLAWKLKAVPAWSLILAGGSILLLVLSMLGGYTLTLTMWLLLIVVPILLAFAEERKSPAPATAVTQLLADYDQLGHTLADGNEPPATAICERASRRPPPGGARQGGLGGDVSL